MDVKFINPIAERAQPNRLICERAACKLCKGLERLDTPSACLEKRAVVKRVSEEGAVVKEGTAA